MTLLSLLPRIWVWLLILLATEMTPTVSRTSLMDTLDPVTSLSAGSMMLLPISSRHSAMTTLLNMIVMSKFSPIPSACTPRLALQKASGGKGRNSLTNTNLHSALTSFGLTPLLMMILPPRPARTALVWMIKFQMTTSGWIMNFSKPLYELGGLIHRRDKCILNTWKIARS